jgi:hypothetical protein
MILSLTHQASSLLTSTSPSISTPLMLISCRDVLLLLQIHVVFEVLHKSFLSLIILP